MFKSKETNLNNVDNHESRTITGKIIIAEAYKSYSMISSTKQPNKLCTKIEVEKSVSQVTEQNYFGQRVCSKPFLTETLLSNQRVKYD